MAYLHCQNCKWEQDDFWTKHYNPGIVLRREIKEYLRPRIVHGDPVSGDGDIHSWQLIWKAIRRYLRVHWTMVWPTRESWLYSNTSCGMWPGGEPPFPPGCPRCSHSLYID